MRRKDYYTKPKHEKPKTYIERVRDDPSLEESQHAMSKGGKRLVYRFWGLCSEHFKPRKQPPWRNTMGQF